MIELALSRRMRGVAPSAVREILKVAERPEIISFAGGLPAPELFPAKEIAAAYGEVLSSAPAAALQYGVTEGYLPLREWLAERLRGQGIPASAERLLVVSGSQQGIDLVARALVNPGDCVLVENPTYLAALQAFSAYEANLVAIPSDASGMRTDLLEALVAKHRPALIYLVPTFQNPKGVTLPLERRRALADIALRHGVPVVEDDPYGALRFAGSASTPIAALADGLTFHLGTFSKTLAPGLRLGWVHGPLEIIRAMTIAKQACDLQTATLAQRAVAKLLESFDYEAHLARIRRVYAERCAAMLDALARVMPEGTRWSHPEGGLFLWLELPAGVDDDAVFRAAIERGVAVVPGSGFFVGPPQHGFVRLNFSNQSLERIELGMERLGAAITALAAAGARRAPAA